MDVLALRDKYLNSSIILSLPFLLLNLVGATAAFILYRLFLHPLARIPGPRLARVSGFWRQYHYWAGTWHDDILKLHETYGRAVRIAPNEVSITDGEAVKRLYGHGNPTVKTAWYDTWAPQNMAPGLFQTRDRKLHSFLRKRVSGVYSMTAIRKFEVYIQACLNLMLQQLMKHARRGDTVDMAEWTNAFAFDVVGELAYGEELGHLRTETDVLNLRNNIYSAFVLMSNLGHTAGQMRLIDNKYVATLLAALGMKNPSQDFMEWTGVKINARLEGKTGGDREDMLAHFVKMKDQNGNPVGTAEVVIEALAIM